MVYVETQESWEVIIKHAEGNNDLVSTDILWDSERFQRYRLVTRASLTKVGTLVKLRTNYGDRLFGPFFQSNFQSHERQHDLLPMCMMSRVSVSFLSSEKSLLWWLKACSGRGRQSAGLSSDDDGSPCSSFRLRQLRLSCSACSEFCCAQLLQVELLTLLVENLCEVQWKLSLLTVSKFQLC